MFACAADQLSYIYGTTQSTEELKAIAMNHIINHPTDFGRDETVESLCESITANRVKGDQILLRALAKALDLTIEIHQSNGQKSNIGEGDRHIYLGYLVGERFISFRPKPELLARSKRNAASEAPVELRSPRRITLV